MAGTLSAPNAIKDIYKKIVFFDETNPNNPLEFQYTDASTLDDIPITNVKNSFIFDNQIKFDTHITGPTTTFTYPLDVTQLAADIYGGAQPATGDHLPNIGGLGTNWGLTNASLQQIVLQEQTDRQIQDGYHEDELNQLERLITGAATGWPRSDYYSAGNVQNPYVEGVGGPLIPATYFIDAGANNITGNAADGLIDADQILDQEILHNRTWLQTLQNLWDGTDGVAIGTPPLHPSGNGAGNNTTGIFDNNNFDIGTPAAEAPKYVADALNANVARPGTSNSTVADATNIKDAILKLDNEIHKNESWLSELHEALYGAPGVVDAASNANTVGEVRADNVTQFDGGTKIGFRTFGAGDDHDSWGRHDSANTGSYLKLAAITGGSTEGEAGRVGSFSQALAELDYQIKNLWDRRDLDVEGTTGTTQAHQTANASRMSLTELRLDTSGLGALIAIDTPATEGATPVYTHTAANSYAEADTIRGQIDELDEQLQHLTDAVQNNDNHQSSVSAWSSDVGAGASVLEDINSVHAELDATQAGAGLNANGSYTTPGGSYTSGNTTIKADVADLETRLDYIDGVVSGSANGTYSSAIGNTGDGALESDVNWLEDKVYSDTYSLINQMAKIITPATFNLKLASNLDGNNKAIENIANAINPSDAVTKGQMDAYVLGFTPGYECKVATQQIVDANSLVSDLPTIPGDNPVGGLMAIDTSHTLANYNAVTLKTWANKGTVTLGGTDYEHGGIAYDSTTYAPKTITGDPVYIDGILLSDGDYVLVAGESLSALDGSTYRESTAPGEQSWHWRNGVWKFNTSGTNSGNWTRPDADILWTVDAAITVAEGQFHPVREGYHNSLSVYQAIAPTVGAGDPTYPVTVEDNKTDADALISAGTYNPVSAFAVFTGIQAIGSGNVTTVHNMNEVHLDFNTNHLEILAGTPDKLQLKLQPYSTANGHAGTDVIPVYNDSTGTGIKIDNNYFAWATGDDSDGRLTVTGTQPINGPSMDLNTSGFVYNLSGFEGKVGIGTGSPLQELHIESSSPQIRLSDSDSTNTTTATAFIEFYDRNNTARCGYMGAASSSNENMVFMNSTAAGDLAFHTADHATAKMTIDGATGKIGIGTATPSTTLEVAGGALFNSNSATYDDHVVIKTDGGTAHQGGLLLTNSEGLTAGNSSFKLSSSYNGTVSKAFKMGWVANSAPTTFTDGIFAIDRYGKVGIGTTTPARNLEVESADATLIKIERTAGANANIQYTNTTGSMYAGLEDVSGANIWGIGTSQDLSATPLLVVEAAGNVGIGTDAPNKKLAVVSGSDSNAAIVAYGASADGVRASMFGDNAGNYAAFYGYDDNHGGTSLYADTLLGSSGSVDDEAIFIKGSDGTFDVGIGTNTPGVKLDVAGAITSSGVMTDSGGLVSDLGNGTKFPTGGIIMWSGAISAIPTGWVICDGTNSTPDLTGRFVVHADADSGATSHNVGASGGSNTVTLAVTNLPSHTHSVPAHGHLQNTHTHTGPSHTHNISSGHTHTSDNNHTHSTPSHNHTIANTTTTSGNHTHTDGNYALSGNTNTSNGNVASANHTHTATSHANVHSHAMAHSHSYNLRSDTYGLNNVGGNSCASDNTVGATTGGSSNANTSTSGGGNHNIVGGGGHGHGAGNHNHGIAGNVTGNSGGGNSTHTAHSHTTNTTGSSNTGDGGANAVATTSSNAGNVTVSAGTGATGGTTGTNIINQGSNTTGPAGSGTAVNITSPYYALAYIMKS